MPEGCSRSIVRGIYRFPGGALRPKANSNTIWQRTDPDEVVRAQGILAEKYGVQDGCLERDQYNELRREALGVEAGIAPSHAAEKVPTSCKRCTGRGSGDCCSDYMKVMLESACALAVVQAGIPGTDGFGRSDNRE